MDDGGLLDLFLGADDDEAMGMLITVMVSETRLRQLAEAWLATANDAERVILRQRLDTLDRVSSRAPEPVAELQNMLMFMALFEAYQRGEQTQFVAQLTSDQVRGLDATIQLVINGIEDAGDDEIDQSKAMLLQVKEGLLRTWQQINASRN